MENETDNLFKKGLAEYRKAPPPHLWNEISGKVIPPAQPPVNGSRGFRKGFLWIISAAFIIALVVWLFVLPHLSNNTGNEINRIGLNKVASDSNLKQVYSEKRKKLPKDDGGSGVVAEISDTKSLPVMLLNPALELKSEIVENEFDTNIKTENASEGGELISLTDETEEFREIIVIEAGPENQIRLNPEEEQVNVVEQHSGDTVLADAIPDNTVSEIQAKRMQFIHGIRYSVGLMAGAYLYKAADPFLEKLRFCPEGVLMVNTRYQRYSLSMGLGLDHYSHRSLWSASVLKTDTTGFYQYVTGVNFMPVYNPVDSTITGYAATAINTATKPVIDTTIEHVNGTVDRRLTYLILPVSAGYEIIHHRKMSVTGRVGFIYNRLIYDRDEKPKIPGDGELIKLTGEEVILNKQFWQYQAGIDVLFEPNGSWYAGASASYRKPFSHWYHKTGSETKPSAWVINASIGIWL